MDGELRKLYQNVILEHGRAPHNFRKPEEINRTAEGSNPICGDTVTVYLFVDDAGVIRDCAFKGKGCAICLASASLMTDLVKGRTADEAKALFAEFEDLCRNGPATDGAASPDNAAALQQLEVLSGVREFPVRIKCATLPWRTLDAAIAGDNEVSTEH